MHFIKGVKDKIMTGKINILPLYLLRNYKGKTDLFISTWALSESSKLSQDYVVKNRWFGAKYLMLAYQISSNTLPNAGRLGRLAKIDGATITPVFFAPNNYYAFR